jgi:hypothetical protein
MSTAAQRLTDQVRRQTLLAILAFAPGGAAPVRALRDDLERDHGLVATQDRVRADVAWLADVGFVEFAPVQDLAKLTPAGQDVVMQRRPMAG